MHDRARVRRVGDDGVGLAVVLEAQSVLARRDITLISTAQPVGFQVTHERAVAAAGLGERSDATQMRNQRRHRSVWRRVEVPWNPLEAGMLTHRHAPNAAPITRRNSTPMAARFGPGSSRSQEGFTGRA